MQPLVIRKIAVLGAGVMGAQIAAHCVNSGFETLLFDLPAKEGAVNGIVDKAIANLGKLKPAPLGINMDAALLQSRNYETDLADLAACDLIIEAIAERLDWKEALYKKIVPHLSASAILVSNTSGLSINALTQVLPESQKSRFCGVHFFNPPRYMHLAELIPAQTTKATLLDGLEAWLTSFMGKGVVRAKDTPNFIANRIGVFSLLATLHHTQAFDLSFDEVDALTGALIGRPKSATYRTMDVVGLDTMKHVVDTMDAQLKDDPWHRYFKLPEWLLGLVQAGALGQKSGQGIYRKAKFGIEVFDRASKTYKPLGAPVADEVKTILKIGDPTARMNQLFASTHKQAQFLSACFSDLFHYCAYHLQGIAQCTRDVDLAMRWGFGWTEGPFETWQRAGLNNLTQVLGERIASKSSMSDAVLPEWLDTIESFYQESGSFDPSTGSYQSRSNLPVYSKHYFPSLVLAEKPLMLPVIYENKGVTLKHFKDDIGILSFKSKANTVGQEVMDGIEAALLKAESGMQGIILYQDDASNFCSGADLRGVLELIRCNQWSALDAMIHQFQNIALRLKYSTLPVVAALRGRALGGGCEFLMHTDKIIAAFESYPGLVELGVGVIPAGGGCKEMALRAADRASGINDLIPFLQPYFQNVAMAQVASSAKEAIHMGYLRSSDTIVMHQNEVLFAAVAAVKAMQSANYNPPMQRHFQVAGIEGHARLQAGLVNWLEGGFISAHDYRLANELAEVMTGGAVNQGTLVGEHWMLKLEREAFVKLAATPESQARITAVLETGKPLRN